MRYSPSRHAAAGVILACALTAARAHADPVAYELDAEHTTVAFLVSHIGYAKVLGKFTAVEGSFVFDENTGELADLAVTVSAASVATDHAARDEHVRNRDFLDAERFPSITFAATGAQRSAFGMTYGVENGLVGDEIEVIVEIEARRVSSR
jgi:polyisoprenoid-binding protein YceI